MSRLCFEQEQLYWEGKAVYAANAPEQSVLRKLPALGEAACLYVLPSPALGYGVRQLLQRLPSTSRILLLEAEPELAEFSQQQLRELLQDERVYFAANDIEGLHALLEHGAATWWSFRRVRLLALNRLYALYRNSYDPVVAWLEHYVQNFWQNRLTLEKLGPLWLRNFFCNLARLPHCQPFGLAGRNLVLAAAGPSLGWHYDWLRTERKKFSLLAVDTALLPLLKASIVPDYVMNLDAQVLNLQDFYGVGPLADCPTLIADLTADPRSFFMLQGLTSLKAPFQLTATRFVDSQLWLRFRDLRDKMYASTYVPELEPLGSVGVSSVAVALQSDLPPEFLLLVGYDFAYPKDLHHVRGTSIHEKLLETCKRTRPCNSFTASLKRPLLNSPTPGFSSDRILFAYAQQLQNYLQDKHIRCARLAGPAQLSSIAELTEEEASGQLHQNLSTPCARQVKPEKSFIREFWARELEILSELEAAIASGKLQNFWHETDFAGDYLLKLCLPKAGSYEWQDCDWGRILHLSRGFSEQLRALLDSA